MIPSDRPVQNSKCWTGLLGLVGALVWLAFGGLLFWQTYHLAGTEVAAAEGVVGPVFYPRLLAVLVILCAGILTLNMLARRRIPRVHEHGDGDEPRPKRNYLLSVLAFASLLAYTWLLPIVGYLILTPVMTFGLMFLMGERRWILMLGISIMLPVSLFLIFRYVVYVLFPEGLLAEF